MASMGDAAAFPDSDGTDPPVVIPRSCDCHLPARFVHPVSTNHTQPRSIGAAISALPDATGRRLDRAGLTLNLSNVGTLRIAAAG